MTTTKTARMSAFSKGGEGFYHCKRPWPETCFCQCGDNGMVFTSGTLNEALTDPEKAIDAITGKTSHYRTAFFEAFPRSPDTFIRGEGATIEAAEENAWKQWLKFSGCPGHEYEARGYENGAGFCKHCGAFGSGVIPPIHPCPECGTLNWYSKDTLGRFWCKDHWLNTPVEYLSESDIQARELHRELQQLPEFQEYLESQEQSQE